MNYNAATVLGVGWGDEGKGKVTGTLLDKIIESGVTYISSIYDAAKQPFSFGNMNHIDEKKYLVILLELMEGLMEDTR